MKKSWQIFWHVFFWISFISLFMYLGTMDMKMDMHSLLVVYLLYPIINISLFYLNLKLLIPYFFNRKRYSLYIVSLAVVIIAYGVIKYSIAALFFPHEVLARETGHIIGFWPYFWYTVFSSLVYIFLSVALKFAADWFRNERIQRDLENQRLSAELSFLKSQINPHFLFNSLNSIYSLAYQRSETTPEAILKLSEIMRYMLYECNDNKVALSKELQYLQNYIDLQKIRFGKKSYIDFKVNGRVDHQQIVPLLLIAFIENAFKHGIANDPLMPISLLVDVDAEHLHFYIRNKKHNNNRDTLGGIGLNNVKRRLDLLYPGKYNLDITEDEQTYTCELSLVL
jgi:two-component system, LytTR family, sensor kinase